jgi:ferredoxin-NADP reductase
MDGRRANEALRGRGNRGLPRDVPGLPRDNPGPARPDVAGNVLTTWQMATVIAIRPETARAKTFRLALPAPSLHLAGQHYLVRLTAPDGYQASRSYSVASAPDGTNEIELTVERLEEGEVSTFLHDEVVVGDELEVRGPLGGWFVWEAQSAAVLVGGGSGVVPLMAMLRLARLLRRSQLVGLVVSVRSFEDLYYSAELPGPECTVVYSRSAPPGYARPPGRLRAADLVPALRPESTGYVCGSSSFADAASDFLVELGLPADRIRVERFGPTV